MKPSICHAQTSIQHSKFFSILRKPYISAILIVYPYFLKKAALGSAADIRRQFRKTYS